MLKKHILVETDFHTVYVFNSKYEFLWKMENSLSKIK